MTARDRSYMNERCTYNFFLSSCCWFDFFFFLLFSGGLVFSLIVSVETQSVTISWRYVWFLAPNRIMLYSHVPYHNDTIIKQTQEDFFNKIFTSHFIARVGKGLLKVCVWEGAGDRTELKYFDPHSYRRQRCVFLVLLMLNWRPWGPLCCVLAFFTASYQQLLWSPNSIGVPDGPFGRVWLSLPHLV